MNNSNSKSLFNEPTLPSESKVRSLENFSKTEESSTVQGCRAVGLSAVSQFVSQSVMCQLSAKLTHFRQFYTFLNSFYVHLFQSKNMRCFQIFLVLNV